MDSSPRHSCVPWVSLTMPKPYTPTMAPALPAAAEMPWQVERNLVGKHSPGTMKVVLWVDERAGTGVVEGGMRGGEGQWG